MPVVATKLDVINQAMARLGGEPFASLSDVVPGAGMASIIYDQVVSVMCGAYPWPFSTQMFSLVLAETVPADGFLRAFTLPEDRLGDPLSLHAKPKEPGLVETRYRLVGQQVWSDAPALWASCLVLTPPYRWTPGFVEAVVLALASELALPICGDDGKRETFARAAAGTPSEGGRGGAIGRAMQLAGRAQSVAALPLASNPMTQAWRGSGQW
jgi:hypothetical protein